jgi:glycosyltransferase involved in cell wall biosynthesis
VDPCEDPWFSPGRHKKMNQVADLLDSLGYDVTVVNTAPFFFASPKFLVINLCTESHPLLRYLQIIFGSFKLCAKLRAQNSNNVFWFYNTRFPELLCLLFGCINLPRAKIVIQIEDIPAARATKGIISEMLDTISTFIFLSRRPSHVFAVSQVVAYEFSRIYKLIPDDISILPPLLSDHYCEVISARQRPFQRHAVRIVYAGGYEKEKGVEDLIDAFKSSIHAGFISELILIGAAPSLLRSRCANYSNICFMGHLSDNDLYDAYAQADIIVNPHKPILNSSYVFPFKTIEIVASGALPLTTRMPGIDDLGLPIDCFFDDALQLQSKLLTSQCLWRKNEARLLTLSEKIRNDFSFRSFRNKVNLSLDIR